MLIKKDCLYFKGYKPCKLHKIDGRNCSNCSDYKKIDHIIGIIKLDAIGDVLRTTSILEPLKKKYPNSKIIWITRKLSVKLFDENNYVDEIINIDDIDIYYMYSLKFNVLFNFDNSKISSSICKNINSKEKYGFILLNNNIEPIDENAKKWFFMGLNDKLKKENKLTYQKIISEIAHLDGKVGDIILKLSNTEIILKNEFIKRNNIKNCKCIGINPGTSNRWPLKKWPIHHYKKIIKKLLLADFKIIIYGGKNEEKIIKELSFDFPEIIIAKTDNNIRKFFALLDIPDIIITSDTLSLHASVALKKKVIALVGPTSSTELELYGNGIILTSNINCSCCYNKLCKNKKFCMEFIKPEIVYDNCIKLSNTSI